MGLKPIAGNIAELVFKPVVHVIGHFFNGNILFAEPAP
jgi:hypothetical protein